MGTTTLESRIEAVTVFREEALVRRVAEIARGGDGWPAEVRIPDLPLCLDDGSVRVRVEGESAPTAPEVHLVLDADSVEGDERPPAEDPELRAALDEEARLRSALESEEVVQEHLEGLEIPRRRKGKQQARPDPSPTAERFTLLDFRAEALRESRARCRDLRERIRETGERVARLAEDDRQASTDRQARSHGLRKCAVVRLSGGEAGSGAARVALEYLVPGGGWEPTYVARFDRETSRVRLELRATVAQRTGEDWTDVELTLSTAEAARFTELPEPTSIRIGRRQPPPASPGWREPARGAEELFADYRRAFGDEPAVARAMPALEADADADDWLEDMPMPVGAGPMMAAPTEEAPAPDEFAGSMDELLEEPQPSPAGVPRGAARGLFASRTRAAAPGCPPAPALSAEIDSGPSRPDADLLDYGRWRMPGADDPDRGYLRIKTSTEASITVRRVTEVEIEQAVAESRRAAGTIARSVPDGDAAERGRFAYAYRATATVTILSDGSAHNIPLRQDESDATLRYVTVPREAQDAYRVATFRNPLRAPLLTGPVDLYLDGAYQMTGTLDHVPVGAEVPLGLGVEPSIKVARNTDYEEESKGLVKGALELKHEIDVEVANHLTTDAVVEVRERLPTVPDGEDDVSVEVEAADPTWEEYDPSGEDLEGGYRWVETVAAGETARFRSGYVVRIPSKCELEGGNRREVSS